MGPDDLGAKHGVGNVARHALHEAAARDHGRMDHAVQRAEATTNLVNRRTHLPLVSHIGLYDEDFGATLREILQLSDPTADGIILGMVDQPVVPLFARGQLGAASQYQARSYGRSEIHR